ncbi:MAG TPA: hypothetical protein VEG08_15505 [Terriglobales bacterium]|nr:hypothetical protein [Terriglobales bacterium]
MLPLIEPTPVCGGPFAAGPDAIHRQRDLFRQAMRDYLAVAAHGDWEEVRRARSRLLDEYLELAFLRRGGSRCSLCGASVRHPRRVTAFRRQGGCEDYLCLCLRCLVAVRADSRCLVERVGPVLYEYCPPAACRLSWRRAAA